MKKAFSVTRGVNLGNRFMARGLGSIVSGALREIIRLKSFVGNTINLISSIGGRYGGRNT